MRKNSIWQYIYRMTIHKLAHVFGWNTVGQCTTYIKKDKMFIYCTCAYCGIQTKHSEVPDYIHSGIVKDLNEEE